MLTWEQKRLKRTLGPQYAFLRYMERADVRALLSRQTGGGYEILASLYARAQSGSAWTIWRSRCATRHGIWSERCLTPWTGRPE